MVASKKEKEKQTHMLLPGSLVDVAKNYAGSSLSSAAAVTSVLNDLSKGDLVTTSANQVFIDPDTVREVCEITGFDASQWRRAILQVLWSSIDNSKRFARAAQGIYDEFID
jgi:hypothetical protein